MRTWPPGDQRRDQAEYTAQEPCPQLADDPQLGLDRRAEPRDILLDHAEPLGDLLNLWATSTRKSARLSATPWIFSATFSLVAVGATGWLRFYPRGMAKGRRGQDGPCHLDHRGRLPRITYRPDRAMISIPRIQTTDNGLDQTILPCRHTGANAAGPGTGRCRPRHRRRTDPGDPSRPGPGGARRAGPTAGGPGRTGRRIARRGDSMVPRLI